ncbi:TonB-dependent receptor [Hyphomicrobium sulfonivorans]|uniref:TonB-dependent receptor n=1 Tax=Hyphomicrobium sulfonivorans TaxID=121290 RepID=UPI00156E3694|nr:TonB-dependent receptor [Hyphomicrobium sulfonivorans]MBI1651377.1 TonB-dependent receptor [Hyphomicrobium sulfonivorans]NSL73298.1 TonB-dependent receptor [Hyphomicrobium sulfonivorans]
MSKRLRSTAVLPLSVALTIGAMPCGARAQQTEAEQGTALPAVTVEAPAAPKAKKKAVKKQQSVSPTPIAAPVIDEPEAMTPASDASPVENVPFARQQSVNAQSTLASNDSARLFQSFPGMSFQTGGGVSSLPYLNGFGDDRLKVVVNGMTLTSSCGNHMNPALSYLDASAAGNAYVIAGITPVSMGGDSLGGTLAAESAPPRFALAGEGFTAGGRISANYRSNGHGLGASVHAYAATEDASIAYTGSTTSARQYKDGNGRTVDSTQYKSTNHLLQTAGRSGNDRFGVDFGWQSIPYQGFTNQYMDMTDNKSFSVNAYYKAQFDWGFAEARVYRQAIRHSMEMLEDKASLGWAMPMETRGSDTGYDLKAGVNLDANTQLRVGHEYHRYRLDDWWPPLAGTMMGPNTYWNINGGERDRVAVYAEVEQRWTSAWTSLVGARFDRVTSDAGDVQGYSPMMYGADAAAFNARNHRRNDNNVDLTATARYVPDATQAYEFGVARKTRSPNLYERYAWSNESGMAGTMVNWFGDLNAYVGNLDLKPEVAHSVRASASWHDADHRDWHVKISGYFSHVTDYIGVELNPNAYMGPPAGRRALRFVNNEAQLGGVDIEAMKALGHWWGDWNIGGTFSYVVGRDLDNDTYLFNIMPANARIALSHTIGNWTNVAEVQAVAAKNRIDEVRGEGRTGAFALLNLRSSYAMDGMRFDVGVDNVFDTDYELPLGGYSAFLYRYNAANLAGAGVHGPGRSFNVGLTVDF